MAVLRTNRAIYHEISTTLYDTIDIDISPWGHYSIPMSPRRLRVQWNLAAEYPNNPVLNDSCTAEFGWLSTCMLPQSQPSL